VDGGVVERWGGNVFVSEILRVKKDSMSRVLVRRKSLVTSVKIEHRQGENGNLSERGYRLGYREPEPTWKSCLASERLRVNILPARKIGGRRASKAKHNLTLEKAEVGGELEEEFLTRERGGGNMRGAGARERAS